MSRAARGFEYRLEHNSDGTVPSSHAFQQKLMSMKEDDNDDEDDDDGDGDEKDNLGFAEYDDSDDSDNDNDNGLALLESDTDEDDDGVSEDNGEPPQGYIQEAPEDQNMKDGDGKTPTNKLCASACL